MKANPGGEFMYGVWVQWVHDAVLDDMAETDAMFRRAWRIDGHVSEVYGWTSSARGGSRRRRGAP